MRLKQRHDPALGITPPRRVERGANFRRVMRVIVDDQSAGVVAQDLETAVDAEEFGESGGDDGGADAELARDGDRSKSIAHVVLAGNEQTKPADGRHFEVRAAFIKGD